MSSSNHICEFDASALEKVLEDFDLSTRQDMILTALKEGAKVLQSQTRDSLRKHVPAATPEMVRGVKMTVDRDLLLTIVSILKEYRLKWFEMGTVDRYRKIRYKDVNSRTRVRKDVKGGYTGKMTGVWFFKEARENDQPIINAIESSVEQQFNAIVDK